MSDPLAWSENTGIGVSDDEITSDRQQGLSLLPATMPELEEALGVGAAQAFMQWCGRTKRAKWDPHMSAYVRTGGRR